MGLMSTFLSRAGRTLSDVLVLAVLLGNKSHHCSGSRSTFINHGFCGAEMWAQLSGVLRSECSQGLGFQLLSLLAEFLSSYPWDSRWWASRGVTVAFEKTSAPLKGAPIWLSQAQIEKSPFWFILKLNDWGLNDICKINSPLPHKVT